MTKEETFFTVISDTSITHTNFAFDFEQWKDKEVSLTNYSNINRIDDTLRFNSNNNKIDFINQTFNEEEGNFDACRFELSWIDESINTAEIRSICYEYHYRILT